MFLKSISDRPQSSQDSCILNGMRNRLGILLLVVVAVTAILGGLIGDKVSAGAPLERDTQAFLKSFTEALATVQERYVRKVSTEELVESAVRGMLRTLDPHSSFFATTDYNRLQEEQQGKYYGLGISIRPEAPGSGRVLVVEPPAPGTPAYKAGLKAGDIISKIGGEAIDDWDVNEEVIPHLKGPKGTKVDITIERPGEPEAINVSVERDEIPLYTIKFAFYIRPRIGYIRIDKFSETTTQELDQALRELDEPDLQGLILDLRDNPGGALNQAINVADRFLKKEQLIVRTRGRKGRPHEYRAPKGSKYNYPMVVLISQASASASEIVAGALQDHDRALIVGESSFGKALVQTIYPLEGNRGLALTTGKYYTPSDRLIQRDYSEGFYDYFYNRARPSDKNGKTHRTDSGRVVYGGGGINPDIEVNPRVGSKLERLIDRRNLFREFAEKLVEGGITSDIRYRYTADERTGFKAEERARLIAEIDMTDATLEKFKEYLHGKKVSFTEEAFKESRHLIKNALKQELFLALFGQEEGFRVALEIDPQAQKGIELLPQAHALLQNSVAKVR